jgi:hypothetical protein
VDLDEILYGDDDIKCDLKSILLHPVASTIPIWRMFKLLLWVQVLNWFMNLDEILYEGDEFEDDIDSILLNLVASTIPK